MEWGVQYVSDISSDLYDMPRHFRLQYVSETNTSCSLDFNLSIATGFVEIALKFLKLSLLEREPNLMFASNRNCATSGSNLLLKFAHLHATFPKGFPVDVNRKCAHYCRRCRRLTISLKKCFIWKQRYFQQQFVVANVKFFIFGSDLANRISFIEIAQVIALQREKEIERLKRLVWPFLNGQMLKIAIAMTTITATTTKNSIERISDISFFFLCRELYRLSWVEEEQKETDTVKVYAAIQLNQPSSSHPWCTTRHNPNPNPRHFPQNSFETNLTLLLQLSFATS